jgi:single-strand DNA-binding protein
MQKTTIIGYIGTGAIVRNSQRGMFLSFSVAVNETWTAKGERQEETTWYNCTYNVQNDTLAKYLNTGTQVYLEGKLKAKLYIDSNQNTNIDYQLYVNSLQLIGNQNEPKS